MIKYTTLDDGSILFDKDATIQISTYYQDPDNPRRYIPKFQPCKQRRFELKVLECGKKFAIWKCDLFCKTISVQECQKCKEATIE